MGQSGTEVTAVEEMTDNEAITEKKGGGGIPSAVVLVWDEAATAEMRSGSDSASNVKEEGRGRMNNRMRTAVPESATATEIMIRSVVCAPVAVRHNLPVWLA